MATCEYPVNPFALEGEEYDCGKTATCVPRFMNLQTGEYQSGPRCERHALLCNQCWIYIDEKPIEEAQ